MAARLVQMLDNLELEEALEARDRDGVLECARRVAACGSVRHTGVPIHTGSQSTRMALWHAHEHGVEKLLCYALDCWMMDAEVANVALDGIVSICGAKVGDGIVESALYEAGPETVARILFNARRAYDLHVVVWPAGDDRGYALALHMLELMDEILWVVIDAMYHNFALAIWPTPGGYMELYGSGAVLSHYMMNINEIATDALLRFGNVLRTVDNNGLTDYRLLDRAMNLMNRSFHDIETVWLSSTGAADLQALWLRTALTLLSNSFDCSLTSWPYDVVRRMPKVRFDDPTTSTFREILEAEAHRRWVWIIKPKVLFDAWKLMFLKGLPSELARKIAEKAADDSWLPPIS